jgi:hypothetical protein
MALILKPQVEKIVIDTFKPPAKPVGEAKVIVGFKPKPSPEKESVSFKELINTAEQSISSIEDRNIIKPKYIKDTSVFYKKSGYLKDLLGEK